MGRELPQRGRISGRFDQVGVGIVQRQPACFGSGAREEETCDIDIVAAPQENQQACEQCCQGTTQ